MTDRSAHAIALLERIQSDGHVREESAHRWVDVIDLARGGQHQAAVDSIVELRERGELREEANERALEAVHELKALAAESAPAEEPSPEQGEAGQPEASAGDPAAD